MPGPLRALDLDAQQRVDRAVRMFRERQWFECPGQPRDMPCDQGRACPNRELEQAPSVDWVMVALCAGSALLAFMAATGVVFWARALLS